MTVYCVRDILPRIMLNRPEKYIPTPNGKVHFAEVVTCFGIWYFYLVREEGIFFLNVEQVEGGRYTAHGEDEEANFVTAQFRTLDRCSLFELFERLCFSIEQSGEPIDEANPYIDDYLNISYDIGDPELPRRERERQERLKRAAAKYKALKIQEEIAVQYHESCGDIWAPEEEQEPDLDGFGRFQRADYADLDFPDSPIKPF